MANKLVEENEQDLLLVTFCLEDDWYGLDTNLIQEVIVVGDITTVHHAPDYVRGISNLRGKIVTILDLNLKLGLPKHQLSSESRILIVPWMNEQVGLLVDSVADVVSLSRSQIESLPSNIKDEISQFLGGVYYLAEEDRLLGLLELDSVLVVADRD